MYSVSLVLIILSLQDFETCVLSGDRECRYIEGEFRESIGDHRRQTLFFCGHEPECMLVLYYRYLS